MPNPRLVSVVLRVRDVAASAWFYREAFGLDLEPARAPEPHAEAAWHDGAQLRLTLLPAEAEPTANAEVGFHVDDLDAAHARAVAAGTELMHEPRDA